MELLRASKFSVGSTADLRLVTPAPQTMRLPTGNLIERRGEAKEMSHRPDLLALQATALCNLRELSTLGYDLVDLSDIL